MAGTDSSRGLPDAMAQPGPAIILVNPQLAENIGTTARAMLNCGLTDLRLVEPRDGWPHERARATASGADVVLDRARLFPTVEAAIADLQHVFATTARDRFMIKPVVTPRRAATIMREQAAAGRSTGVLFGPERTGLLNDHLTLADTLLSVPLNPRYASLNLAQAVLLIGYEWYQAGDARPEEVLAMGRTRPATKEELGMFFRHLEQELEICGFLKSIEKRPSMLRNIRNIFQRAELTEQEIRTLRGIIVGLTGRPFSRQGADGCDGEGEVGAGASVDETGEGDAAA